jgi:hypothetical protein
MKFVGNYKHWITKEVVDFLLNNDGTPRPNGGENPDCEEFKLAPQVGYDMTKTWWYFYNQKNMPFDLVPPIETDKSVIWWFIKMLPGNYMPMHRDPHVEHNDIGNPKRYWMALQDYEPGHVFIYKDTMLTNYKAGDLWEYEDANELHGACNISYIPRLTFLFTIYDEIKL